MKRSLSFTKRLTGKLETFDQDQIESFYLEYFNNFLTIDRFAEYYNFTRYEASRILDIGKEINHNKNEEITK